MKGKFPMAGGTMPMMEDKGTAPPPFIKGGKKDAGRKTTKKSGRSGGRCK